MTGDIASVVPEVAEKYVTAATRSIQAKKVGDQRRYRAESYGILQALEIMVGMEEACREIEEAIERAGARYSPFRLLYQFWNLDRPTSLVGSDALPAMEVER